MGSYLCNFFYLEIYHTHFSNVVKCFCYNAMYAFLKQTKTKQNNSKLKTKNNKACGKINTRALIKAVSHDKSASLV